MRILGIETSCDETSAAIVDDGQRVRSCTIASSRKDFERMGGVIPEEAARKQLESILPTIQDALKSASATAESIDAIAVTVGPGLLGSLLVGTTTAHVLSSLWKKPLIPVHHTLGHLYSSWITEKEDAVPKITFPHATLSVSGGHSDLWLRKSHQEGILLGTTRDDAAGEAFDKGAVLLGLPYPGGPEVEKLASKGNEHAHEFPRPLAGKTSLEFSFSGLKTSLKYALQAMENLDEDKQADIAASYQYAIVRHICSRLENSLHVHPEIREIHLVGGVAANGRLRREVHHIAKALGVVVRFPETLRFCTDNAAMIAAAGYFLYDTKVAAYPANGIATKDLSEFFAYEG